MAYQLWAEAKTSPTSVLVAPRSVWPRGIKAGIAGAIAGVYGQPLIGMSAWDSRELIPGQINVATAGTLANVSASGVAHRRVSRTGPGAATQDYFRWDLMSIHGYLDPTGPELGQALVAQDFVDCDPAAGNSAYYFGWYNFNTAADTTSFVGVAWVGDQATGNWMAVVKDGTATPSNSLHSYDSGFVRTTTCRLGIVLDGNDHTAAFYYNGVNVSTYTPSAVPAQFGTAGVYFGFGMITGAAGTGRFDILGGGNPRLLTIVEV